MRIQQSPNNILVNYTPQFESYNRTKLGKSIDEFIKTENPSSECVETFLKKIQTFIDCYSKDKIIGAGFRGKVFKIDDKYVFKTVN